MMNVRLKFGTIQKCDTHGYLMTRTLYCPYCKIDRLESENAELRSRYLGIDKTCALVEDMRIETVQRCAVIIETAHVFCSCDLQERQVEKVKEGLANLIRHAHGL